MRYSFSSASTPVYAPNSKGGAHADAERAGDAGNWESDGAMVRAAATLHAEDDDFGQAGSLYRDVFNDQQKAHILDQITGHVGAVKSDGIRERAIQYWTNVDANLGAQPARQPHRRGARRGWRARHRHGARERLAHPVSGGLMVASRSLHPTRERRRWPGPLAGLGHRRVGLLQPESALKYPGALMPRAWRGSTRSFHDRGRPRHPIRPDLHPAGLPAHHG
ncbi:catalase-related domain-containing protein [Demequina litorisediminis]|uniref:Catalase immune-responsive domain-containing protein n=1 Tax=Demequina litorisediminis TaxID=1849022 RepID=A0ABQ6IDJ3_9MICO|nr:hypothetical protein GCM10025876_19300 [Demequina litorisediminis]